VLVVGATGSIGRLVVEEAVRKGHSVRALARDPRKARRVLPGAEVVVGDLTRPDTLTAAVESVDAIVFTHGPGVIAFDADAGSQRPSHAMMG
jgi:uncharacterized protein YbjT (DUF2867 family)